MKPFIVVALGRFLEENSIEIALSSFAEFYHSVSYKYQKHSHLIVIDKKYHHNLNEDLAAHKKIIDKTVFLNLTEQAKIEKAYKEASLLLLPRNINSSVIIKEAFLYGLPVLGYTNSSHDNLLDNSSGMKIRYQNEIQAAQELANCLRLLKYDPEAVKMLKKGAAMKYEKEYKWSGRQASG